MIGGGIVAFTPQGFLLIFRITETLAFMTIFTLMALLYVPLYVSNADTTLHYATQQQALSQRIAKDALLLQYGSPSDGVQAINELQNMLPSWESNQIALQNSHLSDPAQALFATTASPYVSIDAAARSILAHPASVIVEVAIIRNQERGYFLAISQVANNLQQQEYDSKLSLFIISEGMCVIVLAIKSTLIFLVESAARHVRREREGK